MRGTVDGLVERYKDRLAKGFSAIVRCGVRGDIRAGDQVHVYLDNFEHRCVAQPRAARGDKSCGVELKQNMFVRLIITLFGMRYPNPVKTTQDLIHKLTKMTCKDESDMMIPYKALLTGVPKEPRCRSRYARVQESPLHWE